MPFAGAAAPTGAPDDGGPRGKPPAPGGGPPMKPPVSGVHTTEACHIVFWFILELKVDRQSNAQAARSASFAVWNVITSTHLSLVHQVADVVHHKILGAVEPSQELQVKCCPFLQEAAVHPGQPAQAEECRIRQ